MKISNAIKEYLVECEIRKFTPRTLRGYKNHLNIFVTYCEEEGITEMEDVTLVVVRQFTQTMIKKGRKGTYINSLLKVIKVFIQYCYDEGYAAFNPKKNFKWVKEDKPVIMAFKPEHIKIIMNNCKGNDYFSIRDLCIMSMFFETGIRALELCSIKTADVHEDFIIIQGKNHKQRTVPITPILKKSMMRYERARENFFAYKTTEDYYFLSFSGRMLTNSGLRHMMAEKCEGIEGIRCSPHTCRHTWAQQQIKMGTDVYTISRLLGHENIGITQTYLNSLRDEDIVRMAKQNSVLMNL